MPNTNRTSNTSIRSDEAPVIAQGLFSYQIGGSERVGADIAIEFKNRGYRVVCFAMYDSDGPIRAELEAHQIPCIDLNYESRPRFVRRLTYAVEFVRFLRRYKVEALLVHHATALVLCGIPARIAGTKRVVMVEHAIHQLRERPNYRRSAMRYMRFADMTTGVDQGIVDYFRDEMRVPASRLKYIPNGVRLTAADDNRRQSVRRALGIEDGVFVFLFVGRLQPVKDVPTLLAAVALLPPGIRTRLRLCIAGDGPERGMLEQQAAGHQIVDTVQFLGARRDVPHLLAAADAFVMTSITEGQPMALIEAMAARLPCIATSVGGIPRLLGNGTGILVSPRDPAAVAEAMTRLVLDPDARAEYSNKSYETVARLHNLQPVVDAYLACLGLPARFNSSDRL